VSKAPRISTIKDAAIASIYEHLLTADAEAYWFRLEDILELMEPRPSGALLHIALTSLKDDDGLVDITYEGGVDDLFTLTAEGIAAAEQVHPRFYETQDDVINASDQKERIEKIRHALDEIEKELRENNAISDQLDGEEKDLLAGEVAAAQVLAGRGKFRLSRLIALIVPMLRFLGEKFAGSATGELAKQLMHLLIG